MEGDRRFFEKIDEKNKKASSFKILDEAFFIIRFR